MSDDIFGPVIVDTQVGHAIEATLQLWMPTYLAMVTRKLTSLGVDIGYLPTPASYVHTSDPDHFPEEKPPCIVIAIPGTIGKPLRDARNYRAMWDARVTVFVTAPNRAMTSALEKYYATAIRTLLLNKRSLGGFAEGIDWSGVTYGVRIADEDKRTLGSSECRFAVDVRDVVQVFAGPLQPITDIPADWPLATKVIATLEPRAIQGDS